MAVGLPVVATDVAGIPELIRHGENGLLIPPEDPAALAAAVRALLADRGLREQLSNAGRETVAERFDAAATARRLRDLFLGER